MAKGILLEVNGRKGTVVTPAGEFKRVPLRGTARVGDEVAYQERPARRPTWWLSAAAIIIFALAGAMFVSPAAPVVAMVTVDINPSVELGVNAQDRVVEATPLNDDGVEVLAAIGKITGKPATEVVEMLVDKAIELGKLTDAEGDFVLITVRPADQDQDSDQDADQAPDEDPDQDPDQDLALQQLGDQLQSAAMGVIRNKRLAQALVQSVEVTEAQVEEAAALGVPVGKLILAQFVADEYAADLPIDESIKNMPVGQVYRLLDGKIDVEEFLAKLNKSQHGKVNAAHGKGKSPTTTSEEDPEATADDAGNPGQGRGKDNNPGQGNGQGKGQGKGNSGGDDETAQQDTSDDDSNTDSNQGQGKGKGQGQGRPDDGDQSEDGQSEDETATDDATTGPGKSQGKGRGQGRGQGQGEEEPESQP